MTDLKVTLKMRRAAISLLVLFCMSGAQTQNEIQIERQDIGAAIAVSIQLDVSAKLNALEQELSALKTRLAKSETEVMNLKTITAAQSDDLKAIRATPKVAFSAFLPLAGYLRAGSNHMNLVLSKVVTNVGEAYSSTTGFFTAPVRGVYYFRFTVVDRVDGHIMGIWLFKNGQFVIRLYGFDTHGDATNVSSGVALELEEGDRVNLVLPAGYRLWDNNDNRITFTGFLIFPL